MRIFLFLLLSVNFFCNAETALKTTAPPTATEHAATLELISNTELNFTASLFEQLVRTEIAKQKKTTNCKTEECAAIWKKKEDLALSKKKEILAKSQEPLISAIEKKFSKAEIDWLNKAYKYSTMKKFKDFSVSLESSVGVKELMAQIRQIVDQKEASPETTPKTK